MKRILALVISSICILFSLASCGESYTCYKCDTTTREAYYDASCKMEWVMCKDCAREYWAPLPYTSYRVQ